RIGHMANAPLKTVLRHIRALAGPEPLDEAADSQLLECFEADHDEAAFAALVRRHGSMVLGVARREVRREQAAEDVFQAAFLLLARKAGSIRKRESVGSWLHGVAWRLAVKARAQATCRRAHEERAGTMRKASTGCRAAWDELQGAL